MAKVKLGAMGTHSQGKIDPSDEGDIKMAIAADPETKNVIIQFGTPVTWLGLPKEKAIAFGKSIILKALELND